MKNGSSELTPAARREYTRLNAEHKLRSAELKATLAAQYKPWNSRVKSMLQPGWLRRLRRAATTDPLTGAYLRVMLRVLVQPGCSLSLVDLNQFKPVNDHYGHRAGDEVLIAITDRLKHLPGAIGVIRSGGDEFWLVSEHELPTSLIRGVIEQPIAVTVDGQRVAVSVSAAIGTASLRNDLSDQAVSRTEKAADVAMFIDKRQLGASR